MRGHWERLKDGASGFFIRVDESNFDSLDTGRDLDTSSDSIVGLDDSLRRYLNRDVNYTVRDIEGSAISDTIASELKVDYTDLVKDILWHRRDDEVNRKLLVG